MTAPPGDPRLFVVEKGGKVLVRVGGKLAHSPYLDLSGQVSDGGEQGLLSIAFSPDYATDGRVYADYTDTHGDTQVVEYRVDPRDAQRVDPSTRRTVLHVDQPFANHNGGLLLFDPSGMLLIGLGDGGSAGDPGNRAQDLGQLLGKVLRIDPRHGTPYSIPTNNPFRTKPGSRPEIWLSGLRNPWRFSFDADGALWIGDVGQNQVEEIDALPRDQQAGRDFGWRVREGDRPYSPGRLDSSRLVEPVAVYDHDRGRCSVTGGVVTLGRYYYGDYCTGEIWTLRPDPHSPGRSVRAPFTVKALVSFGSDGAGHAYVVSLSGTIWRLVSE
ncbi:MAG: hypothetical protein QOJ92_3054 [Frankiales bacterium]|nr:hypothetical protein [Frankiales bacterium]